MVSWSHCGGRKRKLGRSWGVPGESWGGSRRYLQQVEGDGAILVRVHCLEKACRGKWEMGGGGK